jgi:uncharacterized protein (PEP-CTERM system associated)
MGRVNTIRLAALVVALACAWSASASDWKVEAGVSGRETYTDNVTLSASNKQSDFVTEVNPYIGASKRGARFEADLQYSMQNLFYADLSSRNRTNHRLAARAKSELYEEHLYLDATASVSQQNTSLLGAAGDSANATGNVSDVYTLSVSPYWRQRFGSTANFLARYAHSEFTSNTSGLASSSTDGVSASLTSGTAFKDIFWGLDYSDQQTNYSGRSDVRFTTASGTVGYIFTPKFRVSGTVGYDKNEYETLGTEPPQGGFWSAGFAWVPSNRTSLSASMGERYTGKTYGLAFDHRARTTTWHAGYSQATTTTSTQFASGNTQNTFDVLFNDPLFVSRFPDPGQRTIEVLLFIINNNLPPEFSTSLLSNRVFLNKRFDASVSYKTAKTVSTLSVFNNVRESLESGSQSALFTDIFNLSDTVKQRGVNASWLWRMNSRLSANVALGRTRSGYPEQSRTDDLTTLNVGLNRTFDTQLTGSVYLRRQQRDSNVDSGDYTENALIGSVHYKF